MSVSGHWEPVVFKATAALTSAVPSTGHIFKAVGLDTGDISTNNAKALGILYSLGKTGENVTAAVRGTNIKFTAAASLAPGDPVKVTTSGYFTLANSGDVYQGRNGRQQVNSGAIGSGNFDFSNPSILGA